MDDDKRRANVAYNNQLDLIQKVRWETLSKEQISKIYKIVMYEN